MATSVALAFQPFCNLSSTLAYRVPCVPFSRRLNLKQRPLTKVLFALTESSKYPNPIDASEARVLLQELADCFSLPGDYFQQLSRDLRLDLTDAAFDLSNGSVKEECGEELGELLLNISKAWELGDTLTSADLISKLPALAASLTGYNRSALGKRLVSASRRFKSMGQYGQGELQKIAEMMNRTGKLMSTNAASELGNDRPKEETKVLKFGDLQVELTPQKAYIGAVISFVSGEGIQSIPESSLEYANDNALLLAKSLRVALLALFYSSSALSACTAVGLVLYGGQLKAEGK